MVKCAYFNSIRGFLNDDRDIPFVMEQEYINQYHRNPGGPQIQSWASTVRELKQELQDFVAYHNRYNDFHLFFELEVPADLDDVDGDEHKYIDVIIVGREKIALLEFKQRDRRVALDGVFSRQVKSYKKRLKHHQYAHNQEIYPMLIVTEDKNFVDRDPRYHFKILSSDMLHEQLYNVFVTDSPFPYIAFWKEARFVD